MAAIHVIGDGDLRVEVAGPLPDRGNSILQHFFRHLSMRKIRSATAKSFAEVA